MSIYRLVKILVPIGVAIDMVHSFYYVGCMVKENMERIEERKKRELAIAVGTILCEVGKSCKSSDFWPAGVSSDLESVVLPSLVLPPPSYEDHTLELTVWHKIASLVHLLKTPPHQDTPHQVEDIVAEHPTQIDASGEEEVCRPGFPVSTFVQECDGVVTGPCANESDIDDHGVEPASSHDFFTLERNEGKCESVKKGKPGGDSRKLKESQFFSFREVDESAVVDDDESRNVPQD
ncbi:hypothetical protein BSKO_11095 [Bryopsis sp. KO-2023]|nr:hypothetical protein BSKO_11095 [Bryopsis sp. KO-2023]